MYTFSLFDLWPYIAIASIALLSVKYKTKTNSSVIFYTLLIFSCMRYDVGWDYSQYVLEINGGSNFEIDSRFEPISKLIFYISNKLNFFPLAFIVFSFGTLYFTKKSIDHFSKNRNISWLIYYCLPFLFFSSLSSIRQCLCISIVVYSYIYLNNNKYLSFSALIVLSSLIHSSGIVGFFLLVFKFKEFSKITNTIIFIASFFVGSFIQNILINFQTDSLLLNRFQNYVELDNKSSSSIQYIYYLITSINLIYYDKLTNYNKFNKVAITISNLGMCFFNILSFEPVTAIRIGSFFMSFWLFIIPDYVEISRTKYKNLVLNTTIYSLTILSFIYLFIYINAYENKILSKISFIPYKTWINNY